MSDRVDPLTRLRGTSTEEVVCPRCLARFRWDTAPLSVAAPSPDPLSDTAYRRLVDESEALDGASGTLDAQAGLLREGAMRVCPRSIPEGFDRSSPYPVPSNFYANIDRDSAFHEMPYDYGDHERFVVAVVGSALSGKSTYLATLYWSLVNDDISGLGFESRCWEYPPMREYERTEARRVNVEGKPIMGTAVNTGRTITLTLERNDGVLAPDEPEPSAVDRMFRRRAPHGAARMVHVVLFDIAGETLLDIERTANAYPLLAADAFLFMVEADRIPEVPRRRGAPPGDHIGNRDVDRLIEYLRRMDAYQQASQEPGYRPLYERPAAIAISKADMLDTLAPSAPDEWVADLPLALGIDNGGAGRWEVGRRLAASLPFAGGDEAFERALELRSRTVFGFAYAHGARKLATRFMSIFDRTSFHFVSATGSPLVDGRYPRIEPRGVLAPILTLLYQARTGGAAP